MNKWLLTFPDDSQVVINADTWNEFLEKLEQVIVEKGPAIVIEDLGEVQ